LYVFQRTPSSVDVRGNRPTDPQWAEALTPGWQERRRDNFLAHVAGGGAAEDLIDDGWTTSAALLRTFLPGSGTAAAGDTAEVADFRKMNELRARVDALVEDPATAEALKPWYRYMCKRPTFSDSYLQTFNRPNVTLVDTADQGGVEKVTANAVVVDGVAHEVDCLIFATGFDLSVGSAQRMGIDIRGRGGVSLAERWADGPRTLHGVTVHGFPNLFQFGAVQGASAVNMVHILDERATHVAGVVAEARKRQARYVEPTADAEAAWIATIREKAPDTYAFLAECTPGYYNNEGKPSERSESYGGGPIEFHALLKEWRENSDMGDILVE
jgi:cation diffusion facilitator CzcD-associated flavoprotein CzcO